MRIIADLNIFTSTTATTHSYMMGNSGNHWEVSSTQK